MVFEWDLEKEQINIKKHGISFIEAQDVFNDPFALESIDTFNSTLEEIRYKIIGRTKKQIVLLVVCTPRNGKERIISARYADSKEREAYYDRIRKAYY